MVSESLKIIDELEAVIDAAVIKAEASSDNGEPAAAASSSDQPMSRAAKRRKRYNRKVKELAEKGENIVNCKHLKNQGKNNRERLATLMRQIDALIKCSILSSLGKKTAILHQHGAHGFGHASNAYPPKDGAHGFDHASMHH
eukprot:NODE_166_length_1917_cov_2.831901.p2 GENE.NODE_166_length_1917_cov_2.831901~~NODE_166_length_1917_cov_2.831901.p2  ORF type:complete len:142 (-),score=26.30 NODE_166_length_1917_cov_2.831901:63-488(-)